MRKLETLSSIAVPLLEEDVDTDAILPAQFLLLLDKKGLGKHLFHERRQRQPGKPIFVLDESQYEAAEILVAGARFGIGSSREHAVWALVDFGIRCIIAPSFGDIFYANCFKNGILPIRLGTEAHKSVLAAAIRADTLTIDVEAQEILLPKPDQICFDLDPHRKRSLLLGLDEIDSIVCEDEDDIDDFEKKQRINTPWLYLTEEQRTFLSEAQIRNPQ
ncbi:MAG: 3-isopropylmalate dehydratase small subunit [Acidiferrobacterales bacterium]|nr:3-isopropylmalate dehydratase small subunit [Acidiferrobacterales bacterium]